MATATQNCWFWASIIRMTGKRKMGARNSRVRWWKKGEYLKNFGDNMIQGLGG